MDGDSWHFNAFDSGFHWVWEIATMLRRGDASPIKDVMENHILDFVSHRRFEKLSSPRTLTTHRYLHELPDDVIARGCKLVYLLRDPKDVCVSYYNQHIKLKDVGYDGKFEDFAQLFLDGNGEKKEFDEPNSV